MKLKKIIIFRIIILIWALCNLKGERLYVKFGWELFEYVVDARTASLGSATTAYHMNTIQSSISNPSLLKKRLNHISLTHQSRYGGMINNDLIGFQIGTKKKLINLNLLYEGITDIPDTRDMLLDWGEDGIFGTNDYGEGNGIIDQGERLDENRLRFFSQYQLGFHSSFNINLFDFPLGIGLKVLSYIVDDNSSLGIGLDFGYNKIFNNTSIGFVMKNFPSSGLIWNSGVVEGTAPSFVAGISHQINHLNRFSIIINSMASVEGSISNANLESDITTGVLSLDGSFGIECSYKNQLMIRIGKNSVNNLTGGIGLKWNMMGVDYCFLSTSNNFTMKNHHLVSLNVSIDWIMSVILKK